MELPIARDDNLVHYVVGNTTLILTTYTFTLDNINAQIKTAKLVVYADTIRINEAVHAGGKIIQLHCNRLECGADATLTVNGSDGQTLPSQGDNPAIHGGPAGSILIHVHDVTLLASAAAGGGFTLWSTLPQISVQGGKPGRSADVEGKPGADGRVDILYSNPLLRAFAALYDAYQTPSGIPERLRALNLSILPTLRSRLDDLAKQIESAGAEAAVKEKLTADHQTWATQIADITTSVRQSVETQNLLVRVVELLDDDFLEDNGLTKHRESFAPVMAFIAKLQGLREHSQLGAGTCRTAAAVRGAQACRRLTAPG